MHLDATFSVERVIDYSCLCDDLVELCHECFESNTRHRLDHGATSMEPHIAFRIPSSTNHLWYINDLPENGSFEDQLYIVGRANVVFEEGVLRPRVDLGDRHFVVHSLFTRCKLVASHLFRGCCRTPKHSDQLAVWRKEESSALAIRAPTMERVLPCVVLHDGNFMGLNTNKLPHLQDFIMW